MLRPVSLTLGCLVLTLAVGQAWAQENANTLPPSELLPETSVDGEVWIYYWDGIDGVAVDDLRSASGFPDSPDDLNTINQLSQLANRGDSYGVLVPGYLIPPATGQYTFYVAGDDETELWLSTSNQPSDKRLIASVPGWTGSSEFNKYSAQRSVSIDLEAGKRYYFELLFKEAGGDDHFTAAWEGPGFGRQVISGSALASYAAGSASDDRSAEEAYRLGYSVGYLDGSENLAFAPGYPPTDSDGDGLYDNWEVVHGLNPNNSSDAVSDPDGDLLSAAEEFLLGTAENNPDSDSDGIPDGTEFAVGLDPLTASDASGDLDGDGATNLDEYFAGTDLSDETSTPAPDQAPDSELPLTAGFVGQYFNGIRFDDFVLARRDSAVLFDAGTGAMVEELPVDNISVRWVGRFTAPHSSGTRDYNFTTRTDDGTRLYIDGQRVISAWIDQGATRYTATTALEPGQTVDLVMEYYEKGGAAVAQLFITDSNGTDVPQAETITSPDQASSSTIDSDSDGIPDTWELRYGLNPYADDASAVNNTSDVTNLEAYQSAISPWTLETVGSPPNSSTGGGANTSPPPASGSATLTWTAPSTREDGSAIALSEIDSYDILYGTSPDALNQTVSIAGAETSAEITGLESGTWYFAIRVIDTEGLVSEPSDVISYSVP